MKSTFTSIDQQMLGLGSGLRQSYASENKHSRVKKPTSHKPKSFINEFHYNKNLFYPRSQSHSEDGVSEKFQEESMKYTMINNKSDYQKEENRRIIKESNHKGSNHQPSYKKETIDRMNAYYDKQGYVEDDYCYFNGGYEVAQPTSIKYRPIQQSNDQQLLPSGTQTYYPNQHQNNIRDYIYFKNEQQSPNSQGNNHRKHQYPQQRHSQHNQRLISSLHIDQSQLLQHNISKQKNQWQKRSFILRGQKIIGSQIYKSYSQNLHLKPNSRSQNMSHHEQEAIQKQDISNIPNLQDLLYNQPQSIIISYPQIISMLENHFLNIKGLLQGLSDQKKLNFLLQMLDQEKKILSNPSTSIQNKNILQQKHDLLNYNWLKIFEKQNEQHESTYRMRRKKKPKSEQFQNPRQSVQSSNLQPLKRTLQTTQMILKAGKIVRNIFTRSNDGNKLGRGAEKLAMVGLTTAIYLQNSKSKSSKQVNQSQLSSQNQDETNVNKEVFFKKKKQSSANEKKDLVSPWINCGKQFSLGAVKAYKALFPNFSKKMQDKKRNG